MEPPATRCLPGGDVHVWHARLDEPALCREHAATLLSPDERRRASGYATAQLARRFRARRALLRLVLAAYVDAPPERIELVQGPHGKPRLADPATGVRFSLSHSGAIAAIAVALRREVGVDVERRRGGLACEDLVERHFSRREAAELRALAPRARRGAFFAGWTRKEAYLKALGTGLLAPLDGFSVSMDPEAPATLFEPRAAADRWTLADVEVGHGCAAAVAVQGAIGRLRCERWPAAD